MPERRATEPELLTEKAGLLTKGSQFRLKLTGEDGNWSVFHFHGVVYSPGGTPSVSAYGGDANPKGRRQWHSFRVARVVADAMPAANMARKAALV